MTRFDKAWLDKLRKEGRVREKEPFTLSESLPDYPLGYTEPQQLRIVADFPTLNEVINESKKHWSRYSKEKKSLTDLIAYQAQSLRPVLVPVNLHFTWHWPSRKHDPDNIAFAQKYVLDGLVQAGILQGDGWKMVKQLNHRFELDKQGPFLDLIIAPV